MRGAHVRATYFAIACRFLVLKSSTFKADWQVGARVTNPILTAPDSETLPLTAPTCTSTVTTDEEPPNMMSSSQTALLLPFVLFFSASAGIPNEIPTSYVSTVDMVGVISGAFQLVGYT